MLLGGFVTGVGGSHLVRDFLHSGLHQTKHFLQCLTPAVKHLMQGKTVGSQLLVLVRAYDAVQFVAFNQIPELADVHDVEGV